MTGSKKDHERAKSCHCNHISLKAWANIVLGTVDLVPSSTLARLYSCTFLLSNARFRATGRRYLNGSEPRRCGVRCPCHHAMGRYYSGRQATATGTPLFPPRRETTPLAQGSLRRFACPSGRLCLQSQRTISRTKCD